MTTHQPQSTIQVQNGHIVNDKHTTSADGATVVTVTEDEVIRASELADAEVPDGGKGWVVIFGCAVLTWWFIGTANCWGVLQAALIDDGLSSASTLSFVGSLAIACISFLGIFNAKIVRKIGIRASAIMGVSLLGLGEVLSGFAVKNVAGLFMTFGVITGVGISLCFMVVSVAPVQYFKAKRGIANGIVYFGGGLGGGAISFILNALLSRVGTAWTFRILGFITWGTGLPAACLIKQRMEIPRSSIVEWKLLRDMRFVFVFLAGAVATFPLLVPPFFIPLYTASMGRAPRTGAALVAAFNFSSAIGRLIWGVSSDSLGPLNTLIMCLLLNALTIIIMWPLSTSIAPLAVFVIINGAANGGFFSTMPTVVGTVFGSARVSVAMAMVVTGWAGGYLLGSPIAGYILDASGGENNSLGSYRPAIFYAGGMAIVATLMAVFARFKTNPRPLKKF